MKLVFLLLLGGLIVFSQIIVYTTGGVVLAGSTPVIYWVTDPNPARMEQIALFRAWLKKNNYPDIQVKIDTANQGMQKIIVQGVTGVAGDMIDISGTAVPLLADMGLVDDLSPVFKEFNLPTYECYPGNRHELVVEGGVYGTPCNAWPSLYIVNADTFRKVGMAPPPSRMGFAQFEAIGKEFVAKANAGRKRQEVWYAFSANDGVLARSLGLAKFNETLTGPYPDWKAYVPVYQMIHDWTFKHHLLPSISERSSMASDQGYGGGENQYLNKGIMGMVFGGRHLLIQMRQMNPPVNWETCESPNGGYPNSLSGTRSLVLYAGSKNKQWAKYFFAFLRSEEYSMQIVRDSDSMPPLPRMAETEDYLKPSGHTNEWKLHKAFARAANETAIGFEISPFLPPQIKNLKMGAFGAYMSGVGSAESAAKDMHDGIAEMIEKSVARSGERRAAWDRAVATQKKIDGMKARGEKIPASLIANNFLRKYYLDNGMAKP